MLKTNVLDPTNPETAERARDKETLAVLNRHVAHVNTWPDGPRNSWSRHYWRALQWGDLDKKNPKKLDEQLTLLASHL